MFNRFVFVAGLSALSCLATPAFAQTAETDVLFDALGLPEMIEIMHDEGVSYGLELGRNWFPDGNALSWPDTVAKIYDPSVMLEVVKAYFAGALVGDDVPAMIAFFKSDVGQKFVALEVSARRAMLDDAVETAAKDKALIAQADKSARFDLIAEFVATNDLIETNVVSTLNTNFAFYSGLVKGGAIDESMTETQILADISNQEPEIRTNTTEWINAYLLLAYDPATDDEIRDYIAFSKTDAGVQINDALLAAFNEYFKTVSNNLGFEASRAMISAEL